MTDTIEPCINLLYNILIINFHCYILLVTSDSLCTPPRVRASTCLTRTLFLCNNHLIFGNIMCWSSYKKPTVKDISYLIWFCLISKTQSGEALDNLGPFESVLNCLAHSDSQVSCNYKTYYGCISSPQNILTGRLKSRAVLYSYFWNNSDGLGIHLAINIRHYFLCFTFILSQNIEQQQYEPLKMVAQEP